MQRIQQIIRNRSVLQSNTSQATRSPGAPGPLDQWLTVFAPLPLAY